MNQKELNESRRHLSLKRCGIHKLYGCFVSSGKEIISDFQTSFGLMSEFEAEKYLSLLKKTLSGTLGKNLLDLSFSTQQVVDSPEHKRLSALRNTQLEEPSARAAFFQSVIASLSLGDTPYLILLAHDAYDVPHRGGDDELQADASDQVFSYLLPCQGRKARTGLRPWGQGLPHPGDQPDYLPAGAWIPVPHLRPARSQPIPCPVLYQT